MSPNILLTGANGGVGRMLRPRLLSRYGAIRLSDRNEITDLRSGESFQAAELTDQAAVASMCEGIDAIIHLGGQPVEADWDTINMSNIQGCYTLYEEARKAGVQRVIFASSNHAVGMYPRSRKISERERVRPDSRYGVSKAFGEALSAFYADKFGMRTLSIRIGNVDDKPADLRRLSIWIHPDDLMQLCVIGLEHEDLHNEVVFGISDNARAFWDNEAAFRLGYAPEHKAEDHVDYAMAEQSKNPADPLGDELQGGGFGSLEFSGDAARTLRR